MIELEITLRADQAYPVDSGRGIARIDPDAMLILQVSPGDIIEIEGKRRIVAKVWKTPKRDWGKGIIRIDRFVRENACVTGNYVKVRKAKYQPAKTVVLASSRKIDLKFGYFLKFELLGRVFVEGDFVPVRSFCFGEEEPQVLFVADETEPKGAVVIDKTTEVVCRILT